MAAVSPARRGMIAKVHLGAKELGLAEGDRRDLMELVTGKRSAADCSDDELDAILANYRSKGWTPTVLGGGRPAQMRTMGMPYKRPAADHPVARKARAMWISLYQLGVVQNRSEAALEAFARRQLKVEALSWADQSQGFRLIEALKAMAERAGWSQDVGDLEGAEAGELLKARLQVLINERAREARDRP